MHRSMSDIQVNTWQQQQQQQQQQGLFETVTLTK